MHRLKLTRYGRLALSLLAGLLLSGVMIVGFTGPLVQPVLAADCTVTPGAGTYPTIQAAINDPNCDPINVPTLGTYTETLLITRSLSLQGAGVNTVINGNNAGRVVTIDGAGIVVRINNFRITGGNATAAASNVRFGGGILVTSGATFHGEALQIDNNVASTAAQTGFGGGVAILDGSAYLTSTQILSNIGNIRDPGLRGNGTGGGLYAAGVAGVGQAVLRLVDSEVRNNIANNSPGDGPAFAIGGGLRIGDSDNTQVTLIDTVWTNNVARGSNAGSDNDALGGVGDGGAIAINPTNKNAQVTITNNSFTGNIANASADIPDGGSNARGGAILADNGSGNGSIVVTLTNVSLINNIAKAGSGPGDGQGGAIYARKSNLILQGGVITGNIAARNGAERGQGGGIRLSSVGVPASVSATGLTILNNVALEGASGAAPGNDSQGGGIQVGGEGAALNLTNSIVADNDAATTGGNGDGIYIDGDATATIVHVTVAAATLSPGQGIYAGPTGDPNDVLITNTIVTSHTTGVHNQGFNGRVVENYMLFFGNTNNTIGSVVGNVGNVTGDPAFVNPAGRNYHLTANSQAIDQGTDAGLTEDIDGQTRPAEAGFDIGADEYIAAINLTGVTIEGATNGPPGTYIFNTVITPDNATEPISYEWDNGDDTASSTRNLTAGTYTLTVTASNNSGAGIATDSHVITITTPPPGCNQFLTGVTINGPSTGTVGTTYGFTVTISPVDADPPITYTWSPSPNSGQGTANASYAWSTPGNKTVAVTAQNCGGAASASHNILIGEVSSQAVYLPIVLKQPIAE